MKHNRAAAILIMLFSLMAALPVRAEETVKLTVITGIPGTRVAAYAVEPAPERSRLRKAGPAAGRRPVWPSAGMRII